MVGFLATICKTEFCTILENFGINCEEKEIIPMPYYTPVEEDTAEERWEAWSHPEINETTHTQIIKTDIDGTKVTCNAFEGTITVDPIIE